MLKEYISYLKDNPNGLWFKRKLYGWGWTPVSWQGWLTVGVYVLSVFVLSLTVDEKAPTNNIFFTLLLPLALATLILLLICYAKGEKPRWQWGIPKDDDRP